VKKKEIVVGVSFEALQKAMIVNVQLYRLILYP
jgi:hypothetical protein